MQKIQYFVSYQTILVQFYIRVILWRLKNVNKCREIHDIGQICPKSYNEPEVSKHYFTRVIENLSTVKI